MSSSTRPRFRPTTPAPEWVRVWSIRLLTDGRDRRHSACVFLKETASVARAKRRKPQAMVPVVEDLIKLLDSSSAALRRGSYPDNATKIAKVLRAVAEEFDA